MPQVQHVYVRKLRRRQVHKSCTRLRVDKVYKTPQKFWNSISGIFSFATTGLYLVKGILKGNTYDDAFYLNIYGTADNSSYDNLAYGFGGNHYNDTDFFVTSIETFFNCTNVSTHKIKFTTSSMAGSGNTQVFGDTNSNNTCFQFIRLGDSV